ncbi:MAG: hypothetical protein ACRD36_06440 [Candidatus Acidiferrum sp.]
MPQILQAPTAATWMDVLGRLGRTLDKSLAQYVENPEQIPLTPSEDREVLRQLDERLAALQSALDQAEANAAEVDALLAEEAERVERCVSALAAAKQKLQNWANRPV